MPFFTTSAQLRDVAEELFQRISRTPGATDDFARSRMLISVHLTHAGSVVALRMERGATPAAFGSGKAVVVLIVPASLGSRPATH